MMMGRKQKQISYAQGVLTRCTVQLQSDHERIMHYGDLYVENVTDRLFVAMPVDQLLGAPRFDMFENSSQDDLSETTWNNPDNNPMNNMNPAAASAINTAGGSGPVAVLALPLGGTIDNDNSNNNNSNSNSNSNSKNNSSVIPPGPIAEALSRSPRLADIALAPAIRGTGVGGVGGIGGVGGVGGVGEGVGGVGEGVGGVGEGVGGVGEGIGGEGGNGGGKEGAAAFVTPAAPVSAASSDAPSATSAATEITEIGRRPHTPAEEFVTHVLTDAVQQITSKK
jgi:hypothetical protein